MFESCELTTTIQLFFSFQGIKHSNKQAIGRHTITVGTCVSVGILYTMGFPKGHFTHVIIDEAGQATEPEISIPLGTIFLSATENYIATKIFLLIFYRRSSVLEQRKSSHFSGRSSSIRSGYYVKSCRKLRSWRITIE